MLIVNLRTLIKIARGRKEKLVCGVYQTEVGEEGTRSFDRTWPYELLSIEQSAQEME